MSRFRSGSAGRRVALAALVLALSSLVGALVGALRLQPQSPIPTSIATKEMPVIPEPEPVGRSTVLTAVQRHPFRTERSRPPDRYRMPGEAWVPVYAAPAAGQQLVGLQLQGVVTLPGGGGIAALWAPGRPARSVRIGQSYEGYRLVRIEKGAVIMVGSDATLTLRLWTDVAAAGGTSN
jgi:hypothetical protein